MRLTEIPRLFSPTRWAIMGVILIVVVLGAYWLLTEPGRQRQKAAEARAASEFSQARTGAAKDAVGIVVEQGAREDTIDRQTKEAEDDIRSAPEAERNAIALARICMRDAYARDPACIGLREPRAR